MKKKWLMLTLLLGRLVMAQEGGAEDEVRARVDAARESALKRYAQEEAACYQRFAVNDCLRDVKARRRVELESLQRQENALDDADRRRRGAQQIRRLNEKAAAEITPEEKAQRLRAQQAYEEKQERARRKQQEGRGRNGDSLPPEGSEPAEKAKKAGEGSSAQQTREAREQKARQDYQEKLRRAEERKAQRDRLLEEKKGKRARPLPVPP